MSSNWTRRRMGLTSRSSAARRPLRLLQASQKRCTWRQPRYRAPKKPVVQAAQLHNAVEGETDGQFRRNRRRGRRGGRRHRDEGSAPEYARTQNSAHVPGLGEQPTIDFNFDFPKNLALGPINPGPISPEPEQVVQPEIEQAQTPAETIPQAEPPSEPQPASPTETAPIAEADEPQEAVAASEPNQGPAPEGLVAAPDRRRFPVLRTPRVMKSHRKGCHIGGPLRLCRRFYRLPKMAEPTRTMVAPAPMASSKSPLIPMLNSGSPSSSRSAPSFSKCGRGSSSNGGMHIRPSTARP